MKTYKSILFIIILFCLQNSFNILFAQDVLVLSNQNNLYSLDSASYFFEDVDRTLDINQIQKTQFLPLPSTKLSFGYSTSVYWIKMNLKNTDSLHNDWVLEFAYPVLDTISIYSQNTLGNWEKTNLGDHFKFSQRYLKYRNPTYLLDLTLNQNKTFYIRVSTESSSQIPMFISHERIFFTTKLIEEVIYGLYFGMLLAFILYNLALFFSTQELSYLYYVTVLLTSTVSFMSVSGHFFQYILPNYPILAEKSLYIALGMAIISINLFTRDFLNIRKTSKYLYFIFNTLALLGIVILLSMLFVPIFYTNILAVVIIFISLILALLTAYWSWVRGNTYARFFSLAWTMYALGTLTLLFRNAGLLPINFVTSHSVEIGLLLQAILLSMALGDKSSLKKTFNDDE